MGLREEAAAAAKLEEQTDKADARSALNPANPAGGTPAPGEALDVPRRVLDHGGPAAYAEAMSALLSSSILSGDWGVVRDIANDGWVSGPDHDRAMGALAGAGELEHAARKAMPEANIHRPEAPRVVHGTPLHLTIQQHAVLLRGINGNRVKTRSGQSNVEAWDIRRQLNRIFGFGGWELTYPEVVMVSQLETKPSRYTVVYRAVARLVIKNADGTPGAIFEDGAAGDGINLPLGDAHDFALKTALSQALKRCAVNLGDQFGLSLYNGGSVDPVVQVTLAGPVIEGGLGAIEQAIASTPVQGEQGRSALDVAQYGEADAAALAEDPGAVSGNGLPTAVELRDEVLDKQVTIPRLRQIYAMVNRKKGDHPQLGQEEIVNETGEKEPLDYLVYRVLQERKQATGGN